MTNAPTSPLTIIREALDEIIAEAPETEPVYPRDGSKKQAEAWAYEAARWNSAQTARGALAAVVAAEATFNKAREALKAVRDACCDLDTDAVLPGAVGEAVEAALAAMGERS